MALWACGSRGSQTVYSQNAKISKSPLLPLLLLIDSASFHSSTLANCSAIFGYFLEKSMESAWLLIFVLVTRNFRHRAYLPCKITPQIHPY